jgi:hypothetical protein
VQCGCARSTLQQIVHAFVRFNDRIFTYVCSRSVLSCAAVPYSATAVMLLQSAATIARFYYSARNSSTSMYTMHCTLTACMYPLQGGVPSSINVGDVLSLRFQAQDSFANEVFTGGAGKLLCTSIRSSAYKLLLSLCWSTVCTASLY